MPMALLALKLHSIFFSYEVFVTGQFEKFGRFKVYEGHSNELIEENFNQVFDKSFHDFLKLSCGIMVIFLRDLNCPQIRYFLQTTQGPRCFGLLCRSMLLVERPGLDMMRCIQGTAFRDSLRCSSCLLLRT